MASPLEILPFYRAGFGGVPVATVDGDDHVVSLWYMVKGWDLTRKCLACGLYRRDEDTFVLRIYRDGQLYRRLTGTREAMEADAVEKWHALNALGWRSV